MTGDVEYVCVRRGWRMIAELKDNTNENADFWNGTGIKVRRAA